MAGMIETTNARIPTQRYGTDAGGRLQTQGPERTADILVAMQTADDRVDVLLKEIAVLAERLSGVMRQEGPSNVKEHAPYNGATPLSQNIASLSNRLDAAIFQVRGILDRLEL